MHHAPLYRSVNTRTYGVKHGTGGEHRHERHTKQAQESEATLLIRGNDKALVKALRERAEKNGRSAEAEHGEILAIELTGPRKRSFAAVLAAMPYVGEDGDFERVGSTNSKS